MSEKPLPSPVPIRPAREEDYDQIVEVWTASGLPVRLSGREGPEAFSRQLEEFPGLLLVATDGDRVVGVVLGSHDHRKGWINRLAVIPSYRRRGVAAALLSACEAAIRAEGIEIFAALVEPENGPSCALFRRAGYRTDVAVEYFRKLSRPDV